MKFLRKLRSFFPSKLPAGATEFHAWADEVIELSGAPNNASFKFGLATMILHAPATAAFTPKHHFVKMVRKAMANEVASFMIQDIKTKQQEEMAAKAAKPVESTLSNVTGN